MTKEQSTNGRIRHSTDHPCPICDGHQDMKRGQGVRCSGYTVEGGGIMCSRVESDRLSENGLYWHPNPSQKREKKKTTKKPYLDVTNNNHWDHIWDYRDPGGNVVIQVLRKNDLDGEKEIRQRFPGVDGGFVKRTDQPRYPYRLPELLRELDENGVTTLWIAEGEKCVDALVEEGLVATTTIEGAQAWARCRGDCLPVFERFAYVNIVRDRDKDGVRYAEDLREDLEASGVEVTVLMSKTTGNHDDVVDHFAAGHGIDDLVEDDTEPATALPVIYITSGAITEMVEAAEAALIAHGAGDIFQREGRLIRVVRLSEKTEAKGVVRPKGSVMLLELVLDHALMRMTSVAQWTCYTREGDEKRADCPAKVVRAFLANVGGWSLPELRGVIEHPTLRADGSILEQPGFDSASGVYLDLSTAFDPVLVTPTRDNAVAAIDEYWQILQGFPWVCDHDFAGFMAALLTGLVRRSLDTAPLFAFSAPQAGTGKSLLCETISAILLGRRATSMTLPSSEDEMRKRLISVLVEGSPILLLDNVSGKIGGDALCSILTQEVYSDRELSKNRTLRAPTCTLVLATGNNLTPVGDLCRRVVPINLDAKMERPETRSFDVDMKSYATEHRGRLAPLALTVLRAYVVAGRACSSLEPFGGFEDWSGLVRAALVWAGLPDPLTGRSAIAESNPEHEGLHALLIAWRSRWNGNPVTAATVVKERVHHPDLNEACGVAANRNGFVTSKSLGDYLRDHQKIVAGGYRVEPDGKSGGVNKWRVVHVG